MKVTRPFATSIAALLAASHLAVAEHDPKKTNPALSYWQAAASLPELSDEQAKGLREISNGKTTFDPAVLDGLDFSRSLAFVRKGAASAAECEWGLAHEDGPEMNIPHLSKLRELAAMVLVLAESKFAQGDTAAGTDLLIITHHLARDAGASALLISHVVQSSTERLALSAAARHCLSWNAEERRAYARQLAALPPLHPVHEAYASERVWVDWFEAQVENNFEKARKELGLDAGKLATPAAAKEMIAGHRAMSAKAYDLLKLEGADRRAAAKAFEKEIMESKNLLVAVLMPALSGIVRGDDRTEAAHRMLELVLEHGSELTQDDLADTGFKLKRETDGGMELSSSEPEFTLQFPKP